MQAFGGNQNKAYAKMTIFVNPLYILLLLILILQLLLLGADSHIENNKILYEKINSDWIDGSKDH